VISSFSVFAWAVTHIQRDRQTDRQTDAQTSPISPSVCIACEQVTELVNDYQELRRTQSVRNVKPTYNTAHIRKTYSVAPLGWVTPGAATEGVTPLFFFPEKPGDLSPHTFFYLSDLVSPLFFVNLHTNFFPSGVTPLEVVTRGGQPPLPSDATGLT